MDLFYLIEHVCLYVSICVSVCVSACVSVCRCPWRLVASDPSGVGAVLGCKALDVGSRNQSWVLYKSSTSS